MNISILKQISLLSIFLGAALGIITLIPFIGEIAFWVLMCLSSSAVILFLTKIGNLEIQTVQESAILGSIIGFVAFIGFSVFYMPIVAILAKVFQIYPNYGVSVAISNSSFGLLFVLVIFMGVLSATINAFSGFLTFYGIELYKMLNNKDKEKFEVKNNDRI